MYVKDPVVHVRVQWTMETHTHKKNTKKPACTKNVSLHNVEVGHYMVEEAKETAERLVPAMPADTFQRQIRSSSPTDLVSGNPVENYSKNNRDATQCRTPTQNNTD